MKVYATEPQDQSSKKERFVHYFTGIKYLEAANNLSKDDKAAYYKKLVEITEFDVEKAQSFIEKYRDDPERWLKIIESVLEIINPLIEKEKENNGG